MACQPLLARLSHAVVRNTQLLCVCGSPGARCTYADRTHAARRTQVGLAAAGRQYRQPPMAQVNKVPEQMAEEPPEGTEGVPLNLRAKGLTLTELRREGYRVDEMLLEFGVKELIEVRATL